MAIANTTLNEVASPLNLDHVRIDPAWALRVPAEFALRRGILPLSKVDHQVLVACAKPIDSPTHKALTNYLGREFSTLSAEPDSLRRTIARVYQRTSLEQSTSDIGSGSREQPALASSQDAVQVCDEILQAAILRGASDIHLVPCADHLAVQLRVDGQLELYRQLGTDIQPAVVNRLKVLAGMDIAEKRSPQDGRITSSASARERVEMRVATLPTRYGERMTMRLLGGHSGQLTLAGLGMSPAVTAQFSQATARPHGLILLTGPTGSGKSTTLYVAIEQLLNTRGGNVITIEDPIEYEISGASQVEVDSADKVSFTKALRSLLRHDPDVVMIGEIRDAETASIAVKASLTGHLVFSTLHTNTALGVVTRLIDLGVDPFLVAATLRLSVAQRLVRKLCAHCRRPRELTGAEARLLERADLSGATIYEPGGCVMCAGRGFQGRTGLFELLAGSAELAELISGGATEENLLRFARQQQLPGLLDDAVTRLLDGTTSLQEVTQAVTVW